MQNQKLLLIAFALFFSAPCVADEQSLSDKLFQSAATLYAAAYLAQSDSDLSNAPLSKTRGFRGWYSHEQALAGIEFQGLSPIGRMRQARSLSLLTLAESRRWSLFLGVSEDGTAGIRFRVFGWDNDRHLELARMPYL